MADKKAEAPADEAAETSDETEEAPASDKVAMQWVGHSSDQAHVRTITREDWDSVGVDHEDTTWNRMDPMTEGQALVSPRAAEYLEKVEPGFKKVPDSKLAFALKK